MIKGPKGIRLLFVLLALVGAVGLVMSTGFLFSGPKDKWVCENGVWVAYGNPSSPKPTAGCGSNAVISATPDQAVNSFYEWYLKQEQNPLSIGSYSESAYLTPEFKNQVAGILGSTEGGGYDPFLCAQDIPESYRLGKPAITGDKAVVMMEQTFGGGKRLVPIEVSLIEGNWEISDVLCSQVIPQQGLGDDMVQKSTVIVYYSDMERAEEDSSDCSLVYGVERVLETPEPSVQDVLTTLFAGPTSEEKSAGYSSLFSSQTADILKSAKIRDNVAYVDFKDIRSQISNASTSCGSAAFIASIEETLKHNFNVRGIYYAIEGVPADFYEWLQIGCDDNDPKCDPMLFR